MFCSFIRPGPLSLHIIVLLTLSSLLTGEKGSRLMAFLAFLQTLDSNMAVGRQPEEGQRPQGSSGGDIKILKGQRLQCLSHHILCSQYIFKSVLFYYCEQYCKHCWSNEKQREYSREAVEAALTIPTTVTTSLTEMKTHQSELWWNRDRSEQLYKH